MSYVMPPGLGQSVEDFMRRRQAQAWARSGDTVEGTAGRGWVKPGAYGDNGEGDAVNGGATVVQEPPPPPPAPAPPPEPFFMEQSQPVAEPTFALVPDLEPEVAPAAPVGVLTTTEAGPDLVDITVQLRNSGNLNAPGANTNLRFSMPGLGGSLCAVGAAVGQLPAGSRANNDLLGEWFLTGEWGGALGCSFTAASASQGRPVVAEAEIPAQETPYTPGADYCPPGQIPKPDGTGCYEPCPMRSQEYNEVTGECEDITCPPGTIIGAYGECVELVQTDAGPIGVPYVEPEPEAAEQSVSIWNGIDLEDVTFRDPSDLNGNGDRFVVDPQILVTCAPGWWPSPECDQYIGDPSEWGAFDRPLCGPGEVLDWREDLDGEWRQRCTPWTPYNGDSPGNGLFSPDLEDYGGNGYGNGDGEEDPFAEDGRDDVFFNGNGLTLPGGPIYNGDPPPVPRPYVPTAGPGGGAGGGGAGGGGVITNGEQPLLSPGVEGDGFGILQVGLGVALAWVLAQSYARAPK